jgi:hypothetical protein
MFTAATLTVGALSPLAALEHLGNFCRSLTVPGVFSSGVVRGSRDKTKEQFFDTSRDNAFNYGQ